MSGTQGNLLQNTPLNGGWIIYNALEIGPFSANLVQTRNALADYSLNRTATGPETYHPAVGLNGALKRLTVYPGLQGMPFQTQFGTAAGGPSFPFTAKTNPPFTGASNLTPDTGPTPKGIRITSVRAIYQVGVVDLTSASLSLNRTVFANNTALSITNVPISPTALPLTAAGDANGPYVVSRAVTTPAFEVADLADLTLEMTFVMANTGTIRLYGLGFLCDFNYN